MTHPNIHNSRIHASSKCLVSMEFLSRICCPKMSQVTFKNVRKYYPTDEEVMVCFDLEPGVKPSPKDFVGIYEQGWTHLESAFAFKFGPGQIRNTSRRMRRVIFKPIELRKADANKSYVFVYVNKYLETVGESTSFKFISSLTSPQEKSVQCEDKVVVQNQLSKDCGNKKDSVEATSPIRRCQFEKFRETRDINTTCADCNGSVKEIDLEDEINEKALVLEAINEEIFERVSQLEDLLDLVNSPEEILEWDREKEEMKFNEFVRRIIESRHDEGRIDSDPDGTCFDLGNLNRKELFMKSVIGQQEKVIQHLSNLLFQVGCITENEKNSLEHPESKEQCDIEPVQVVKAKIMDLPTPQNSSVYI